MASIRIKISRSIPTKPQITLISFFTTTSITIATRKMVATSFHIRNRARRDGVG